MHKLNLLCHNKPMHTKMEQLLGHFAAPVLAGIKPAALINCRNCFFADLCGTLADYNKDLNSHGIYLQLLCQRSDHGLVMVYRHRQLCSQLGNQQLQQLLMDLGYPPGNYLEQLQHLQTRLSSLGGCPFEIGLFLGYPVHDVLGYQLNQGKNYLLLGHWKVYQQPQLAQQIFANYDYCSWQFCQQLRLGKSIASLVAAPF